MLRRFTVLSVALVALVTCMPISSTVYAAYGANQPFTYNFNATPPYLPDSYAGSATATHGVQTFNFFSEFNNVRPPSTGQTMSVYSYFAPTAGGDMLGHFLVTTDHQRLTFAGYDLGCGMTEGGVTVSQVGVNQYEYNIEIGESWQLIPQNGDGCGTMDFTVESSYGYYWTVTEGPSTSGHNPLAGWGGKRTPQGLPVYDVYSNSPVEVIVQ